MCDVSAKLIAWQDGELPDEAASIERHVATCAECRNRLVAYKKVSAMVDAYCNAALASKARRRPPAWAPALGAAASVALLLVLFLHTRSEPPSPAFAPTAATAAAATDATPAAAPPAIRVATHAPLSKPVTRKMSQLTAIVRKSAEATQAASFAPTEPAIHIAIPAESIFPPGALPEGIDFVGDVSLASDGSAQRIRLQPQLTSFEGGLNP